MKYTNAQDRDANFQAISGPLGLPFVASKRITFAGGTTNGIGDYDGTGNPFTIFTVTGDVLVSVIGAVKQTLVGAGTLEVGVTNATAAILAQVSDATTMAINEVWGADNSVSLAEAITPKINGIAGGLDIIGTAGSTNITAGIIDFYCFFRPLSADGNVEAAL